MNKENQELENKIKDLEKQKEDYLRKAVNAEINKVEKENEWLIATIKGIIKEANIDLTGVYFMLKEKYKFEDKSEGLTLQNLRFNPWRIIELPDNVYKKMFPADYEVMQAHIQKNKEKALKEVGENN